MTTLQTPFLSDLAGDGPIPHRRLAYLRERARNRLFEFVLKKFLTAQEMGLTKAKLARRIHHRPEVITRLLGSPGNWTIDTAADLLVGIAGEELEPASSPLFGNAPRNARGPEWLSERVLNEQTLIVKSSVPTSTNITIEIPTANLSLTTMSAN